MVPHLRRLPLLAVSLLAVALPGCGGSSAPSKADYQKQVKKIGEDFRSQVTSTEGKVSAATDTNSRVKALDEFKNEFSSFADRIAKLTPPDGAKNEQDAVVSAFRKGASDIGDVESAVKSKDTSKIKSSAQTFQSDASSVQQTLQKLSDAVKK